MSLFRCVSELLGVSATRRSSFCVRAPIDGYYRVLGPVAQSRSSDGKQANNSLLPEGLCSLGSEGTKVRQK
ncbi:uncharacterized [Tachysurus ichikawai]